MSKGTLKLKSKVAARMGNRGLSIRKWGKKSAFTRTKPQNPSYLHSPNGQNARKPIYSISNCGNKRSFSVIRSESAIPTHFKLSFDEIVL